VHQNPHRALISIGTTLVAVLGALGVLSACGGHAGSQDSAYCGDLKKAESSLGEPDSGEKLQAAFSQMHQLNDESPDAVKQDWATVDKAITDMEGAFHSAGLEITDLDQLTAGDLSNKVDPTKLQAIVDATQELQGKSMTDAVSAIESDAKDECGLTLKVF
jgi:hypothetical protein